MFPLAVNGNHDLLRTVVDNRRATETLLNFPDQAKPNEGENASRARPTTRNVTRRRAALISTAPQGLHLWHATK